MTGLQHSKIKSAMTIVLILTATMVTLSFLKLATAQTEILSITPSSGFVGSVVELTGNISTENGAYVLQFDEANLTSGIAVGYEINATFEVPDTFEGNHNVRLIDKDTAENDTTFFEVLTSYELKTNAPILPKQLQEGDNVTIFLYVAGGEQTITMDANVTVRTPRNESYTKVLNLTISDHGNGSKSTVFPDDFPNGANTNYTGEYSVLLNGTLANQTFLVGLTDSLEYHRSDLVNVRATGYRNNENVTITVSFEEEMIHTENVTADKGVIDYSGWVIPKNASMGIYALNITSISIDATKKDPPDFQNFSIPGYSVNVTTRNLAKEPVSNVIVRVYENTTSIMNATSNSNGVVNLMLERGNYTCEADFKDVKVGELALSIVKEASFDLYCNLTNLHILVKDESDYLIPEAEVELAPENLVLNTNINGTAIAHSLLPNVTYTLNSSRYGEQFNTTTIEALIVNDMAVASYNVTVICPAVTLQVNLHDSEHQPIPNAAVRVQEFMGGLFYEGNVVDGSVTFSCTFGRYKVKVYRSGVEVNQTTVDLFENQSLLVICRRCGLTVHIKVVDYLGQPISNANVSLLREGLMPLSDRTNNDGSVTFDDFIGGLAQVSVYLTDQTQPCVRKTFLVESSTTIDIKIERYVLVLGFLVETSQLATVILVMAAIFIVLLIEVFRRRQIKS